MPQRIKRLSAFVANQIAAGEVVERPASIVKELIENSLDADARRIVLTIEQGGVKRVRVADDGVGIHADDLALAVCPHATSKIDARRRLWKASARWDFAAKRSQASRRLPKLRSVPEWPIPRNGSRIEMNGGDEEPIVQPTAHPRGTTVEVSDLFYNTPARRKFLKTERTEVAYLNDIVTRLALGRLDVEFEMRNGTTSQHLPPSSDAAAPSCAIARGGFRRCIGADRGGAWLVAAARLGRAADVFSRPGRSAVFLRQWPFRQRQIVAYAVKQAYRDVMFHGRHPVFVLYLDLDPRQVDVNVHPTKYEVRFADARGVRDFVFGSLNRALRDLRAGQRRARNATRWPRAFIRFDASGDPASVVAGIARVAHPVTCSTTRTYASEPTRRINQ